MPSPLSPKEDDVIRYLVFDTETTGLPADGVSKNEETCRASKPEDWPEIVQLTAEVWDIKDGVHTRVGEVFNFWINIEGEVPQRASEINGITKGFLDGTAEHGKTGEILESPAPYFPELKEQIIALMNDESIDFLVAHNMPYDEWVLRQNIARHGGTIDDLNFEREGYNMIFDTTQETKSFCRMVWDDSGSLKRPKLVHLYGILFPGEEFPDAHDARADVAATVKVIKELYRREIFSPEHIMGRIAVPMRNLVVDWDKVAEECKSGRGWKVDTSSKPRA